MAFSSTSPWAGSGSSSIAAPVESTGGGEIPVPHDDISTEERQRILSNLNDARSRLESVGLLKRRSTSLDLGQTKALTNFEWPLRQAPVSTDFSYYGISNFVDEDLSYPNHVQDYNCGTRTYDLASGYNHKGTDIFLWPFSWKKMSEKQVEIVAGSSGTILYKSDGNFDQSCGLNSNQWNAVYVQHSDGSVAWYGHMKNGSLTPKPVGATVKAGEYLGAVGSSGSSTGPHLHLELYDANNRLIDPWQGACNAMSKGISWANQPPYYDPNINAITVGLSLPTFPTCPGTETPNASGYVPAGGLGYFTLYVRDLRTTDLIDVKWYKPDGSLWQQSTSTVPPKDYTSSYWYWSRSLPTSPTGTWRFEATLAGKTVAQTFQVGAPAAPRQAVYRFYNSQTGAHFFTLSEAERDYVIANLKQFNFEGAAFYAYTTAQPELTPVYRFYNTQTSSHFYTISASERDYIILTYPAYNYEGAVWYAQTSNATGSTPLYRFYNSKTGTHFFTVNSSERDYVIQTYPSFTYENTAYYVWEKADN